MDDTIQRIIADTEAENRRNLKYYVLAQMVAVAAIIVGTRVFAGASESAKAGPAPTSPPHVVVTTTTTITPH